MSKIVSLMRDRNQYLVRYYNLNEREMKFFKLANFDSLDAFYETRQAILEIVAELDARIDEELMLLRVEEVREQQDEMGKLLSEKDSVVEKVLDQDLQVISMIELEKGRVLAELLEARGNKKAVGAYKSGNVRRSFDQEA